MTDYRRLYNPGATCFFAVNLAERRNHRLLVENIDALRNSFARVQEQHQFRINAAVVLPNHLHYILTLPPNDTNYSERWGLIKAAFSRTLDKGERVSASRRKRGERGIWQRRFCEPMIRDDVDYSRHID